MFDRHVVRQLTAYCHRELTQAESTHVEQHLKVCDTCRQKYEDIRLVVDLASQTRLHPAPDSLWDSVERAVEAASAESSGRFSAPAPWHRPAIALASEADTMATGDSAERSSGRNGRPATIDNPTVAK